MFTESCRYLWKTMTIVDDEKQNVRCNFALVGRYLGHSYSQRWFEQLFSRLGLVGYTYKLHEMESLDGLRRWVEAEAIGGFNVTVPYKQAVIPMLDWLSPEAEAIGAVNCVVVDADGRLEGHNTDAPAFRETLASATDAKFDSAVVLGTGGAARAVGYALDRMGISHVFASRHPALHADLAAIDYDTANQRLGQASRPLIVNATPVGMYPDVDGTPWSGAIDSHYTVYDLVYNPAPTRLLQRAKTCGAEAIDGMAMLCRQAELSWHLFAATCGQ